jgi:formylglycine-generating enzyme required for sulfatase activity
VTLTRGFTILSTEVTQTEFNTRMTYNPSSHTGCDLCPVETVNWYEAAAYCNALSGAAGRPSCYTCSGSGSSATCSPSGTYETPHDCPGYRLPTEGEWEYAARAGDTRATFNGDLDSGHLNCETPNAVLDSIAWFCGNSGSATHAVGTRAANAQSLYDMIGNVWEWCHDSSDGTDYSASAETDPRGLAGGSYQALRGGSCFNNAEDTRAARRYFYGPTDRYDRIGFRPVRTLP